MEEAKDGKGKPYYKYELLTTAGAALTSVISSAPLLWQHEADEERPTEFRVQQRTMTGCDPCCRLCDNRAAQDMIRLSNSANGSRASVYGSPRRHHLNAADRLLSADVLLCCAADGHEGGRHHLIAASVSGGNLYILKVQVRNQPGLCGA